MKKIITLLILTLALTTHAQFSSSDIFDGITRDYPCTVTDVYDGDTVTVDIHLGFGVTLSDQKLRLYGINAPELRGDTKEEGVQSKIHLVRLLKSGRIILRVPLDKKGRERKGKYGRWLAILVVDGQEINDIMIMDGHAISYMRD